MIEATVIHLGTSKKEQIIRILIMLIEVIILDNKQSYVYECEHSPHPSASKWKAFLAYLICKRKFYFRADSSAICRKCGTHIRTPRLYRSPLLLMIYCTVGILLSVAVFLPWLGQPNRTRVSFGLFCLAWLLFDRMFVAAIFAFAKWPTDKALGNCSGKDAIWSNNRLLPGLYCSLGTLLVMLSLL